MRLSIVIPAIRPHTWLALYESIPNVLSGDDYELIFVSPHDLPPELVGAKNVRLIKDFGCVSRCNQIGILHSQGEYVTWGADAGVFSPTKALDKAFAARPPSHKGIVSFSFNEEGVPNQDSAAWWKMGYHRILRQARYVPDQYLVIMQGLMRRDYLMEIGGWDCNFEHTGLGTVDLAVRLQNDGAAVVMGEKIQDYNLPHNPNDRKPVKGAHRLDKTKFTTMYMNPDSENRTKIDFDNWQSSPAKWARRFG